MAFNAAGTTTDVLDAEGQRVVLELLPTMAADVAAYTGCLAASLARAKEPLEAWIVALSPLLGLLEHDAPETAAVCDALRTRLSKHIVEVLEEPEEEVDPNVLIHVDPLTLGYMGKILLLRAKMNFERGHKYGVVGGNGVGKTTLMRKLALGELPGFPQGIKTMYVQPDFGQEKADMLPLEYLQAAMVEESVKVSNEKISQILSELSFTEKLLVKTTGELSGGWQMRLSLARASLVPADLLLLDEPTNHLDNVAVDWLTRFLKSSDSTVIVISHEPRFLDDIATDIMYMKNKKLNFFPGNFSQFCRQQGTFTAKDLAESARRPDSEGLNFRFPDPGKLIGIQSLKRTVLSMKNVTFSYPTAKAGSPPTLTDVDVRLCLSSRVAIVGPNGAGKSTLVKLLVNELKADQGKLWRHHNLRVAYVGQHSFEHLEKVAAKPAIRYIQQRFRRGYDAESAAFSVDENEEHQASSSTDLRAGEVENILGRRKFKNKMAYEVKWKNQPDSANTWETGLKLKELGAWKLVQQCDERIRSKKCGLDQRALTTLEVTRHLMDFGLDSQYANSKIAGLSGGQKCKLVLAGAMWLRPHMIVLDEPTNYLDLEALGALTKAIRKFKGGVIVVSHNMEFLSQFCAETWQMDSGHLTLIENLVAKPAEDDDDIEEEFPEERRRQRSTRHSSTRQSVAMVDAEDINATESIDVDLLGEMGLRSHKAKERRQAALELHASIEDGALLLGGQLEDAKAVLMAIARFGLADKNDLAWNAAADVGTALVEKHAEWSGALLPLLIKETTRAKVRFLKAASQAAALRKGERIGTVAPRRMFVDKFSVASDEEQKRMTEEKRLAAEDAQADDARHDSSRCWGGLLCLWGRLAAKSTDPQAVHDAFDALVDACSKVGGTAGAMLPDGKGGMKSPGKKHTKHVEKSMVVALGALAAADPEYVTPIIDILLGRLVTAKRTTLQEGVSVCLAGILKARPTSARTVVPNINAIFRSKADSKTAGQARIGCLLAYARLFENLGPVFEHYIRQFLPILLEACADRDPSAVKAARHCCKAVFSSLTTPGAKMILPMLLALMENKDWKKKVHTVTVLGSMSYCSPALMAKALPVIVPMLLDEMLVPQKALAKAAQRSLEQIGSVIANPEIKPLVSVLMASLKDAFNKTRPALEMLSGVSFAHAIDPASLALIYPIVANGLTNREATVKALSLKVIAALTSLVIAVEDILPYFGHLLIQMRLLLQHQNPIVRAEAATSLGSIYHEVGGDRHMPTMMPWLLEILNDPESTETQTSGAALGLSHILSHMALKRTSELLPGFLTGMTHTQTSVRICFMQLLALIGEVLGPIFADRHLDTVLPCVLAALPDRTMAASEACMATAQALVAKNTETHTMMMLPLLVAGLDSANPQLRRKFLQLLGTVLLNLVTTSNFGMTITFYGDGNKLREDEITNQASEEQEQRLLAVFGAATFQNLFSKLYLMRADADTEVASMAWRVWHLVIPSEVDLLRRLLDTLIAAVLTELKSDNKQRVGLGQRSMSDLVVRLGDDGLNRMVPILDGELRNPDSDMRKAVALGFERVLFSADKQDIGAYLNDIIPSVRYMLVDNVPLVRKSAGKAFGTLVRNAGSKVIKRVVPQLMALLQSDSADAVAAPVKLDADGNDKGMPESATQASVVDGLELVLTNCDLDLFFFLCSDLLTQICTKNPNGDLESPMGQLREYIVVELTKVLTGPRTQYGPKEVRTACRALHRFCEETEDCTRYLHHFIEFVVRQHKQAIREPMRQSCLQCLLHAFGFHKDKAKAAEDLTAFFLAQERIEKEVLKRNAPEYVALLTALTPVSNLSKGTETLPEVRKEQPADVEAVVAAPDVKKNAVKKPSRPLTFNEKYCCKCDKIKAKTKFSKKSLKLPNGPCKMCQRT